MDFRDTESQAAWRTQVRQFLSSELPDSLKGKNGLEARIEPTEEKERWRKSLAERGWVAPAWPREYGGAGLSPLEQFILNEEFAEAQAPQMGGLGVMMLGPTLIAHGTEEQKKEHIPRILNGEVTWCQGYSEPGAGSDLASLQTRAVRDGDDFVINGQKIWTSQAHEADWMFMLARTDPDAPKHRGISYFLLDMKTPGITVQPLVNMANQHNFNEVFFEDVRVPARNALGEIDRGWYVGTTTLDFERSSIGNSVGQRQAVEKYLRWFREHQDEMPPENREAIRGQWAERWIEVGTATLLAYRIISMQAQGQIPNSEASIAKLFNTELSQRVARTGAQMLGMWGMVNDAKAPMGGETAQSYVGSVSMTIAGGTSEIQRNIIATRGLGLPRG
ncbi:MAG: acyl-CoA dehydrogenase family protein [Dehalococcoidia bacterium]|nr:acyl-CoA dehydrogenase family protein [Dehalococcoidia bacterium]